MDDCGAVGPTALVYNSDTVGIFPIVEVAFPSDPGQPANSTAQMTLNSQSPVTFTLPTPGNTYALAVKANTPVTSTGTYSWTVQVSEDSNYTFSLSGTVPIVVNASSPFGPGWTLAGDDSLVSVTGGVIWASGTFGKRFFPSAGTNSFQSPPNDFGTLTGNSTSGYAYVAKDQVKWNFNSSGLLTTVVDPHGLAVTYSYSCPTSHNDCHFSILIT